MSYLKENLDALLKKRNMSATALSQATGVPQPTIHRILSGVSKDPRTDTIQPLADYFNVPVETLRSTYLEVALARAASQSGSVVSTGLHAGVTPSAFNDARYNREQQFLAELGKRLGKPVKERRSVDPFGIPGYRFDYASERVVAEFNVLPVKPISPEDSVEIAPSASVDLGFATRRLWLMSCSRLGSSLLTEDRHYLMFFDLMPLSPIVDVRHVAPSMVQLIVQARDHGIHAFWQGPRDAATIVATVERGAHPSNADVVHDFDDLTDSQ